MVYIQATMTEKGHMMKFLDPQHSYQPLFKTGMNHFPGRDKLLQTFLLEIYDLPQGWELDIKYIR